MVTATEENHILVRFRNRRGWGREEAYFEVDLEKSKIRPDARSIQILSDTPQPF